jgi:hypothetical protein
MGLWAACFYFAFAGRRTEPGSKVGALPNVVSIIEPPVQMKFAE